PTHRVLVEPVVPDYPNQPGIVPGETQAFGKFAMYFGWKPSEDFPRLSTIWGMPLRPGINLAAELSSFIAYWQVEGRAFHQVQ
ncbi:DNA-binding protein, partial [Acinetobacter baumannii]|nr:DNA-binding protein [Acinetobacter baumannii]